MSIDEQMLAALQDAMLKNPMTLSVSVAGGTTVSFATIDQRNAAIENHRRQIALENGSRRRLSTIRLDTQ